jgi:hypothetical protein
MTRRGRLTVTVACALAIVAAAAPTAVAAGSPLGYAISAVGFPSYFVFDSQPGGTARGTLQIVNLAATPRTIVLAPADVSTASAGGLQYGEGTPQGQGRWLKLSARSARLAGGSAATVPFTVHVARDAGPGDHFLGIVAIDRRVLKQHAGGTGAIRLRLIPRLAMTIRVRLPGASTKRLSVGDVRIAVAPSGASLAVKISNPANTLVESTGGDVTVSQGSSPLFSQVIGLAAFVPDTAITYHVPWDGTPVEGTYRVRGILRPAGARSVAFDRTVTFGGKAIRQYRRQTGRQAKTSSGIPVVVIVVLALAVVLAVIFGVAYTRARRQLRDRS